MTLGSHDLYPDRIVSMIELARWCYEWQGGLRKSVDICNEMIKGMDKAARTGHNGKK
ncbi:hypothetical protein F5Y01DRAFT_272188 [Xylaria sp. FL0043]|nr:hypothetical protein F5Y01DRAFT_272188 [Xylaria sp. FL0043]